MNKSSLCTLVAVAMGIWSGLLFYMIVTMLAFESAASVRPSVLVVSLVFLVGSATSVLVLRAGARSVAEVFTRGFLLGAVEWLCLIPAGAVFAARAMPDSGGVQTIPELRTVPGFLTPRFAILMSFVCFAGAATARLMLSRGRHGSFQ